MVATSTQLIHIAIDVCIPRGCERPRAAYTIRYPIFSEETAMPLRSILIASAPLAFLCALFFSTTAHAGCEITIEVKNDHDDMVTVNWWHSEVKIKNGFWRDLSKDLTGTKIQDSMEPGAVVSRVYGADFGCDKQRQYRFEVFTAESRYWIEAFPRIPTSRRRRNSPYT